MKHTKQSIQHQIQHYVKEGKVFEAGLLKLVLGEIQNREAKGNVTPADIEGIIRHQIRSIQGMIDIVGVLHPSAKKGAAEITFYETLVPRLLPAHEVRLIIVQAIAINGFTKKSQRGQLINIFRDYPGMDMSIVSMLACELLND